MQLEISAGLIYFLNCVLSLKGKCITTGYSEEVELALKAKVRKRN